MHIGIVLTDTYIAEEVVRNYVLELIFDENNECTHALARVGHSAFRFYSDGTLEEACVKNRKRRAERPLSFGDVIEWDDKDVMNRIILKIRRVSPLFESRVYDGKSQILVKGVVSPTDNFHFWSQYFPNIQLDLKSAQYILPNIAVSAWLNLSVDSDGKLCIEFDSFESIEHDGSMVATAPWNHHNSKYTTLAVPTSPDSSPNQILSPISCTRISHFEKGLINRKGLYTGNRLIFCKELFSYEIVVVLFNHHKECVPLSIGMSCVFSAIWNVYEKKFIVTKYRCEGLGSRLSANGLIRASIKAVPDYPGVYTNEYFGLIDDPKGALAFFHLSTYKDSSVTVTLEDKPCGNTQFRFRVIDVQPDKAPKLQKWMEKDEIIVENVHGIVVGTFTVFSRAHPEIVFHFSNDVRIEASPGKLIKFSARYQHNAEKFLITEFTLSDTEIFSIEKRLVLHTSDQYQRAFRISATKSKVFDGFLEHDVFGLIDIGGRILIASDCFSELIVWVMKSPSDSQRIRADRAPFVVVSVGEQEPNEVDSLQQSSFECNMSTTQRHSLPTTSNSEEPSAAVTRFAVQQTRSHQILELDVQAKMEHMELSEEEASNHLSTCTDTCCAANCPTLQKVMYMMDIEPNFLEVLSAKNPSLFIRCINQIFS